MDVQRLAALPPVEEVLAVGVNGFEPAAVDQSCTGSETTLR
jgi:hypothetical protein